MRGGRRPRRSKARPRPTQRPGRSALGRGRGDRALFGGGRRIRHGRGHAGGVRAPPPEEDAQQGAQVRPDLSAGERGVGSRRLGRGPRRIGGTRRRRSHPGGWRPRVVVLAAEGQTSVSSFALLSSHGLPPFPHRCHNIVAHSPDGRSVSFGHPQGVMEGSWYSRRFLYASYAHRFVRLNFALFCPQLCFRSLTMNINGCAQVRPAWCEWKCAFWSRFYRR